MLEVVNGQPQSRDATFQCQLHRHGLHVGDLHGTLQLHWTTRGASQVALGSHRNSAQPTTRNLLAGATNPGGGILSGIHNMVDRLTCATHDVSTAFTSRAEQSESIPECSVLNRSTYLSSVTVDNASGRLNAADAGGDGLGELSTASALNRSGGIGICGGGGSKIPRLGRSPSGTSNRSLSATTNRLFGGCPAAASAPPEVGGGAGGRQRRQRRRARHAARRVRAVAHRLAGRLTRGGADVDGRAADCRGAHAAAAVARHAVGDVLVRVGAAAAAAARAAAAAADAAERDPEAAEAAAEEDAGDAER